MQEGTRVLTSKDVERAIARLERVWKDALQRATQIQPDREQRAS